MKKQWETTGKARSTRKLYKKRAKVLQHVKLIRRRGHLLLADMGTEDGTGNDSQHPDKSAPNLTRADIMKQIRDHKVIIIRVFASIRRSKIKFNGITHDVDQRILLMRT